MEPALLLTAGLRATERISSNGECEGISRSRFDPVPEKNAVREVMADAEQVRFVVQSVEAEAAEMFADCGSTSYGA